MSILFALLGAFSQALTSVLQRLANLDGTEETRSGWETAKFLVRQPIWLLGMVCMGGTFVFTALALYFGTLATVQPILVVELIFTMALRLLWLGDRIAPVRGAQPSSSVWDCSDSSLPPTPRRAVVAQRFWHGWWPSAPGASSWLR